MFLYTTIKRILLFDNFAPLMGEIFHWRQNRIFEEKSWKHLFYRQRRASDSNDKYPEQDMGQTSHLQNILNQRKSQTISDIYYYYSNIREIQLIGVKTGYKYIVILLYLQRIRIYHHCCVQLLFLADLDDEVEFLFLK